MTKYLIQRPGCCWALRLPSDDGRMLERSLGTKDKHEAEIIALRDYGERIAAHKAAILARRPRVETAWVHKYPPGKTYDTPCGKVLATDRELHYLDAELRVIRTEPNGGLQRRVANLPAGAVLTGGPDWLAEQSPLLRGETMARLHAQSTAFLRSQGRPIVNVERLPGWNEETTKAEKVGDDAIIEGYLNARGTTGYPRREVINTWEIFKSIAKKPLRKCNRDDGRALAQHFRDKGLKLGSVKKRLVRLAAAVKWAIEEEKLPATQLNPFAGIVAKADKTPKQGGDAMKRLPLTRADLDLCKKDFAKLSASDQLLFRLLACTGMRLGEALSIDHEEEEDENAPGVRYVVVGTKTESSHRRVPLPAQVLPYLPKRINAPLFPDSANTTSQRLNTWLRRCGITDKAKSMHSLRHRAHDVLRAAECPDVVQRALLGHAIHGVAKDVHDGYGSGWPLAKLQKWIDKIDSGI